MKSFLKAAGLAAIVFGFAVQNGIAGPDAKAMEQGKKIYTSYCQTCHQATGQGLPGIYPPLAKSDYLKNNKNKAIQGLIFGLSGEITVNGKKYNGMMPAAPYKDDELAAVLTYVRASFGNALDAVTPAEVAKIRKAGKSAKY